jgi:hypothetical protein
VTKDAIVGNWKRVPMTKFVFVSTLPNPNQELDDGIDVEILLE